MRRACVRVRVCWWMCGWVGGVCVCDIVYYIEVVLLYRVYIDWNMAAVAAAEVQVHCCGTYVTR